MAEEKFYQLTKSQKIIACIAICFACLSGAYCLMLWYEFFLFDSIENCFLRHLLSVCILVAIFIVISIITWISGSYAIKITKMGEIKEKPPITEDGLGDIAPKVIVSLPENVDAKYTRSDGLGEIDFYWGGDRKNANIKIQEYLEKTKANQIFIAAIGFGTIKAVIKQIEYLHKSKELKWFKNAIIKKNNNIDFVFRK